MSSTQLKARKTAERTIQDLYRKRLGADPMPPIMLYGPRNHELLPHIVNALVTQRHLAQRPTCRSVELTNDTRSSGRTTLKYGRC